MKDAIEKPGGARQPTGFFASPINTATGLGIVSISCALAVGQFTWGAAQPSWRWAR